MAAKEQSSDPESFQSIPDDVIRELRDFWQMRFLNTAEFRSYLHREVGGKISEHDTRLATVERRQKSIRNWLRRGFTQVIKGIDGDE